MKAATLTMIGLLMVACTPAAAQVDPADMERLGERLALARQGELVDSAPAWLEVWELPDEIRAGFQPPQIAMRVAGENPYVLTGGRSVRLGEMIGGHALLAIMPEGIVLDVEGYPVLIE